MSGPISEEDVLGMLLLEWLRTSCDPDLYYDGTWLVRMVALDRISVRNDGELIPAALVRAIADSERRLEVERCEREVLDAALAWGVGIFGGKRVKKRNGDLLSAVCRLEAARMGVCC